MAPAIHGPSLSLEPVAISKLPPADELIRDGYALLEASVNWKKERAFSEADIFSYSFINDQKSSSTWYCRVTQLRAEDFHFSELWRKLGRNKLENEKRFKADVKEVTLAKHISDSASVWTVYCASVPPFSPKVFTEYHVAELNDIRAHKRVGLMVSIPVELPFEGETTILQESGVMGRRVQVEWIKEFGEGVLEWRMAICEYPGGILSSLFMKRRTQARLVKHVAGFLLWYATFRGKKRAVGKTAVENMDTVDSKNTQMRSKKDLQ